MGLEMAFFGLRLLNHFSASIMSPIDLAETDKAIDTESAMLKAKIRKEDISVASRAEASWTRRPVFEMPDSIYLIRAGL